MPEQEAVQLFPKMSGRAFHEGMEDSRARFRGQLLEEEMPQCVRVSGGQAAPWRLPVRFALGRNLGGVHHQFLQRGLALPPVLRSGVAQRWASGRDVWRLLARPSGMRNQDGIWCSATWGECCRALCSWSAPQRRLCHLLLSSHHGLGLGDCPGLGTVAVGQTSHQHIMPSSVRC